MLLVDRRQPRPLAVARVRGGALRAQLGVVLRHRVADAHGVAAFGEPLLAVLGERLQLGEPHAVARSAPRSTSDLSTRAWRWSARSAAAIVVVGADRLGRRQVATAGEHRQPLEDALLVVEEQLVAPVDHRAQRLLARQRGARPAGEQAEPIVQADEICVSGNARVRAAASSMASGSPSRRAQMSAITAWWSSESSSGAPAACARATKRLHGVVGRERRHRPDGLAADSQSLAARGEEPQRRAAAQQVLGDLGGRRDHVLAVVEHDQHLPVTDQLGEPARVRKRRARPRSRRGRRPGSPTGASSTRQPPNSRSVGLGARHLQREPRLADPARPDERDEPMLGEQLHEVAQLGVAADQRCQRFGNGRATFGAA